MDAAFDSSNDQRIKTVNGLLTIAEEAGLDSAALRKMIVNADDKLISRVNEDMVLGTQSMSIMSTPTFVVLAEGVQPKAFSINRLKQAMEEEPYKSLLK